MSDSDSERSRALVAAHLDTLFRVAWRLTRNRDDAQDLVQDTCLAAAEHLATLGATDNPLHWLLRVQHNRFLDGFRRRQRSPVTPIGKVDPGLRMASPDPGPEELLQQADAERRLHRAFLQLDDMQRTLLALRAEGHDLAEIEAITGLRNEVLRVRLHRARRALAGLLEHQDDAAVQASRVGSGP